MTVQEPRARIVRDEANRDVVRGRADAHDVATRRVGEVVLVRARDAYDVEVVPVQVHRVLLESNMRLSITC